MLIKQRSRPLGEKLEKDTPAEPSQPKTMSRPNWLQTCQETRQYFDEVSQDRESQSYLMSNYNLERFLSTIQATNPQPKF